MFKIQKYSINEHGESVQHLLDNYMIPIYLKRMGLTTDQRMDYVEMEEILDPKGAYNQKFEPHSLVVCDGDGKVIACQLSYCVNTDEVLQAMDTFRSTMNDPNSKFNQLVEGSKLLMYLRHQLDVGNDIIDLLKKFPNTKQFLYLESSIVEPSWRKRNINAALRQNFLLASVNEMVIVEGMMKKEVWDRQADNEHYEMGTRLYKCYITYDNYACSVYVKPPLKANL